MGPFYAYLKDNNHDGQDQHCRYLITFVNRETADEWWRMISTPPSPYARNIKRISPHFYFQNNITHNINIACLSTYNTTFSDAGLFRDKMFTTLLYNSNGRIPHAIRPTEITDHISGRWYFIRSKANPCSHWYLRVVGECLVCGDATCDAIHVSSEYRTKFCIRVRDLPNEDSEESPNFVMIGKDEISIAARKNYVLYINDEDLKATRGYQGETDLLFKDFKNRFITRAERQVNGEIWEYVESVERGSGEAWELVD